MLRRTLAVVLGCGISVLAGAPCPDISAEPLEQASLIRIRNKQQQPLTAVLIELVDYPGSRFLHMVDDLFRAPTAGGEERRIEVKSLMPGTVPDYLQVTAAIYADGAICGTTEKVKLILDARRHNLVTNRELISRIEKARSAGASTSTLIEELDTWARSAPGAVKSTITHVAGQLKQSSISDVLAALQTVDKVLASSKPAL